MTARTYDEFMAETEKSDPLLFAAVAALYPVLSHSTMRKYRNLENGYNDHAGGYHCAACRRKEINGAKDFAND